MVEHFSNRSLKPVIVRCKAASYSYASDFYCFKEKTSIVVSLNFEIKNCGCLYKGLMKLYSDLHFLASV